MTEHSAVIFVFFFLAEYASIVLICILNTVLFLGGYLLDVSFIWSSIDFIINMLISSVDTSIETFNGDNYLADYTESSHYSLYNQLNGSVLEGLLYASAIGVKSCIMIFTFIWVRASFPRIRFDQLMSFSWTILLPIVIAFIVLLPCVVYSFDIIPCNINLF